MSVWESSTGRRFFFPRRSRLSRRDNFPSLLKHRAKSNQWFFVYSQPNHSGCARLGLTVSKRIIPMAVQRNRIKRVIRECFRAINREGVERDIFVKLRAHPEKTNLIVAISLLREMLREILAKE